MFRSFSRRLALTAMAMLGMAAFAPHASADELFTENFNSWSVGSVPTGWSVSSILTGSGPTANRDGDVEVATRSGSNRMLQLDDSSDVEQSSAIVSFDAVNDNIDVRWQMMMPQSMTGGASIQGRLGTRAIYMIMSSSGSIRVYDGDTFTTVDSWSTNTWYTFRAVIDMTNDTFDFYVDGDPVAEDFDLFETPLSRVSSIRFFTSTPQSGTLNVDFLRVFGDPNDIYSATYGAPSVKDGEPVGGGSSTVDYDSGPTSGDADFTVSSSSALDSALSSAGSGDIIWVTNGSNIQLNSQRTIPAGVTLASGRGQNSNGGRLHSTNTSNGFRMLRALEGVRIVGLRLEGPDGSTGATETAAIHADQSNIEVDGCYIYNWGFAGIHMTAPLGSTRYDTFIHHNRFRFIRMNGLGYPVTFNPRTGGIVMANDISSFRHAIAHWGDPGDHYRFSHNEVGTGTSFAVDMHTFHEQGGRPDLGEDDDNDYHVAGDHIQVYRNTFSDTNDRAIKVRGMPDFGAFIYDNDFEGSDDTIDAIAVDNSEGNMFIERNRFSDNNIKIRQNYRRD